MEPHIKEKMNNKIRQVMKENTGPSFEERLAERASQFRNEAKATETAQNEKVKEAVARARARPCDSAPRPAHSCPPSIEQHAREHAHTRRTNERNYAKADAERRERMRTREPLFRLSEVSAAFEMQRQRMIENKKRMKEDEEKRWFHLRELQERVLYRPLLMQDPTEADEPSGNATGSSLPPSPAKRKEGEEVDVSEAEADRDPNWRDKFQAKMTKTIQKTIKARSGPSFEERVAVRAKKFQQEAKATEAAQTQLIEAAVARAKAKPMDSAFRSKEDAPPSIEDWGRVHAEVRAENEARYAEVDAARKHRMKTREPLFRVSEVEAAFEMQRQRAKERKRQLTQDEKDRWAMLNSMQERVIDRPLLVEKYDKDRGTKSNPDIRLIPNHAQPMAMQQTINKCVSQKWFKESAWGKEVAGLRERMDARPKLHEISYPPKVIEERPPPPKMSTPLDDRLKEVMQQAWFKRSAWASDVEAIQQRQNERTPLSQITYPPKER